jgi:hypothetical protein
MTSSFTEGENALKSSVFTHFTADSSISLQYSPDIEMRSPMPLPMEEHRQIVRAKAYNYSPKREMIYEQVSE